MTHGEIWTIDFGQPVGSLPSKIRPTVVMQNDLLLKAFSLLAAYPPPVMWTTRLVAYFSKSWKKI